MKPVYTPESKQIEILESRIAPAVFFVGANGTILNSSGAAVNDTAAASVANSTAAVDLHTGDILEFAPHNGHAMASGDKQLMKVTQGSAIAFLEGVGGANVFSLKSFSGIAVTDGFTGLVTSDVYGPVGTGAVANGNTLTFTPGAAGSIAGLTVTGHIRGDIYATNSISNVKVTSPGGSSAGVPSVGGYILTGDQVAGSLILGPQGRSESFNGGNNNVSINFNQAPGTSGGSISNITLSNGAFGIYAADGAPGPSGAGGGAGGSGGSITNVNMTLLTGGTGLFAGRGGASYGSYAGGAGGSITGVTIIQKSSAGDAISLAAGSGGTGGSTQNGSDAGNGGAGGSISNSKLSATGIAGDILITAGGAGAGGQTSNGGSPGLGGHGGQISNITGTFSAVNGTVGMFGGSGGAGNADGAGGGLTGIKLTTGVCTEGIYLAGGDGGAGTQGNGGAGGSVTDSQVAINGYTGGSLNISGGAGAAGAGAGGGVSGVTVEIKAVVTGSVQINGGSGGQYAGTASNGYGKVGGAITNVIVKATAPVGSVQVSGGNGGNGGPAQGGTGGAVSQLNLSLVSVNAPSSVAGGYGGYGLKDGSTGGTGGSLTSSTLTISHPHAPITLSGGNGGETPANATGGVGGSTSNLVITDTGGLSSVTLVTSGDGGYSQGGSAGNAGTVSGIKLTGPKAAFGIASGAGGASYSVNPNFNGGDGGNISEISGSVGTLFIQAGAGGYSYYGAGGNGASVSNVTITAVGHYVRGIAAGDGGQSLASPPAPGAGGSIQHVNVAGDIGDFSQPFDASNIAVSGMGGLIAGLGGNGESDLNGGVSDVTAHRIAAIVAGQVSGGQVKVPYLGAPENASNYAVSYLADINATVIGADLNGNGLVNDSLGGVWTPADTNDLADGVVLTSDGYTFTGNHPAPLGVFD